MSYGKVHEEYWDGEKIEPLSDRAALLGLFLITGRHRNAIGCFRLGIGAIMDLPRFNAWGFEGVSKALQEMVETGFIVRDDRTGWTYICNALVKDHVNSPKGAIHAAALAARVPSNNLVYQRLIELLKPQLEVYSKVLKGKDGWPIRSPIEAPSKPHRSPLPSPLPSPSPEPLPEPEPIQGSSPSASEHGENSDLEIPIALDRTTEGDALRAYNALAEKIGLPVCQKFTDQRRKKLRKRLEDCGGLEGWKAALAKVESIPGLRGSANGDGHEEWRCNLDFLLTEAKFIKLMEGAYDHWGKSKGNGAGENTEPKDKILRRIAFYEDKRREALKDFDQRRADEFLAIITADREKLSGKAPPRG